MKFKVSEDSVATEEFQCMDSLYYYLNKRRALGLAMINRAINKAMSGESATLFVQKKKLTLERV